MRFDFIIIGAGTAGCIVASRLSEIPSNRVLLVEAGGSDRRLIVSMPAALPFVYQDGSLGWGYESGPEPNLGNRLIDEKRGRVIGGTSSINAMIFNRGNPLDFDGWARAGLSDWDYAHCLPYFRRLETFSGGEDEWRGGSGPMFISRCKAGHKLHEVFLRGGEQAGFSLTPDHNGFRQEGLHVAQAFVHKGLRWTTARGYLRPAAARENLHIVSNASVRKIVIDKGSAVAVELVRNRRTQRIDCEREIILSAGTFNTPQLLMLSGVGDGDELRRHGIGLEAHVPQVGRNLENHPGVNLQYATNYEDSLVSELNLPGRVKLAADWLLRGKGLGASNYFETGAFLRTRANVDYPNMQFEFLPLTRQLKNGKLIAIPGFQFWMDLCRPESRGEVRLRSADPFDAPSIVFNHLASRQDLRDLVDGIRLARRLIAQPAWDRYRGRECAPGAERISDADLEAFVRSGLSTSFHPTGTCRMGTDAEAVVDGNASVKAVRRLRIVDASIMPKIVSANISATIIMMAEKLADVTLGRPALRPSTAAYYRR
jgi:choline dehydrogenase